MKGTSSFEFLTNLQINFIVVVVKRAFVASQANVTFFGGELFQMRPMNHFRIWITCAPFKQRMRLSYAPLNFWDLGRINLIYTLLSQI